MSFYRSIISALAAFVVAVPVFADQAAKASAPQVDQKKIQVADASNSAAQNTDQQAAQVRINLNTATVKDLMQIKGINAYKAKSIIAYREKNGNFKSIDDLAKVKGFKRMKKDKLITIQHQLMVKN